MMEQVIKRGNYEGFDYLVAKNSFGNYNGYFINLSKEQFNKLNNVEYLIHGGITLVASKAIINNEYVEFEDDSDENTVIGFDTMHVGDFLFEDNSKEISKWLPINVETHIKEVIDYIK